MHNFHDARGQFPIGARNNPRQTWVMHVWSYIEQDNLTRLNNLNVPFHDPPATVYGTMNGLCGARLAMYYCPSDTGLDLSAPGATYQRRRGNYVINWGNARYDVAPPAASAPFAHIGGNRATPRTTTMSSISDGTSNTLLMSEYLMAKSVDDNDWRGDIHNDDGVFKFMTLTTPNSTAADVVNWAIIDSDPLMPVSTAGTQFNAARSRHSGGVNALLCDGSVRFVTNNIAIATWGAMGTMDGGEVVGNF
jgi:prepilin-type processing-associated H-X9-DG protein